MFDPKCMDYMYEPEKVVEWAEIGTENAILNAENFASAGFAIYAQDQFGLKEAPIPARRGPWITRVRAFRYSKKQHLAG